MIQQFVDEKMQQMHFPSQIIYFTFLPQNEMLSGNQFPKYHKASSSSMLQDETWGEKKQNQIYSDHTQ